MSSYDAWLEAPYQEAYARDEAIEQAIETLGLTDEEAETYDFDQYFADLEQDYWDGVAEARAEDDYWD